MGKASRSKRRAPVRAAKRAKTNTIWYAMTALVVIVGLVLILVSRPNGPGVGPIVSRGDHWHAALGVYVCDHWATDPNPDPTSGQKLPEGTWIWPGLTTDPATGQTVIGRVGTSIYAGLHSHVDGIIHMEPQVTEDSGKNATLGRYFKYGGWKISGNSFEFLNEKKKNGDKCGTSPGTLQWAVNGKTMTGNPSHYKLFNDDRITIAFLPKSKTLKSVGPPPSVKNLAGAEGRETSHLTPTTVEPPVTIPVTETSVGAAPDSTAVTPTSAP